MNGEQEERLIKAIETIAESLEKIVGYGIRTRSS